MIPSYLLSGTIVLLATSLASAGPCRPSSIASLSTISIIETSLQSSETQAATETITTREASFTASVDTIQADTTTTELSIATTAVETTTEITSDTATTAATATIAATTTATVAEPVQSVYLFSFGSSDPSLASGGGIGYSDLETVTEDLQAIDFGTNADSNLVFAIGELTGQVKIGNGPSAGKSAFYFKANVDYSGVLVADAALGRDNGLTPLNCRAVDNGSGSQVLQCKYDDIQDAEFWTCASRLILVKPGVDFTRRCPNAQTSYRVPIILAVVI